MNSSFILYLSSFIIFRMWGGGVIASSDHPVPSLFVTAMGVDGKDRSHHERPRADKRCVKQPTQHGSRRAGAPLAQRLHEVTANHV